MEATKTKKFQEISPSLNEHYGIIRSMGGILCDCPLPVALAPAGMCPQCGVEGPFYRQALEHYQVTHNGNGSMNGERKKYKKVDWEEAFRTAPSEVNWLFPPLLEASTINVLFGLPGVGKSLLVLNMILDILREGKRVAVVDEENRVDEVVERMKKFGVGTHSGLEGLSWYSFPQLPPLDTMEGGAELTGIVDDEKPDLVVLDTTTRMVSGDENSASTWLQLYRCSLAPLKQRGIAVLRLDHQGKDASKGQRGSSAKDGDADSIWRLKFQSEGYFALEREKSRSGHGEDWVLVQRLHDPLRHVFTELDHLPVTPRMKEWADRFDSWGIPRDAGRPTLKAAIEERWGQDPDKVGISTTILSLVVKYRKGLDSQPQAA